MSNESPAPLDFYSRRSREVASDVTAAKSSINASRASLAVLVIIAAALCYESFIAKIFPVWLPALIIPFAALISRQMTRANGRFLTLLTLAEYYEKGTARLQRNWQLLDEGQEFKDPEHFYASDLDLFGRGSLFQLLCSARTQAGRKTLAAWMKSPATREEVFARHAAVSEIAARQDLRETLAIAGSKTVSDCKPETFRSWLDASQSAYSSWAPATAILLVLATVSLPVLYWIGALGLHNLWLGVRITLLSEAIFAAFFLKKTRATGANRTRPAPARGISRASAHGRINLRPK